MKRVTLVITVFFYTCLIFGQKLDTIWYTNKWEKTKIKAEYYYYSIVTYDSLSKIYNAEDHFPDGKIQMTGQYSSMEPKVKNGQFTWYYRNGNKRLNNIYKKDSLLVTEEFNEAGKSLYGRTLRNGYKELLSEEEKQKLGIIDKKHIDEHAEFPEGNQNLMGYIQSNIIYPQEAVDKKMEGRVIVIFTVSKSGRIKNVRTPYNIYPVLEREARRLFLCMPKWKPGKSHGEIVEEKLYMPIDFKLRE